MMSGEAIYFSRWRRGKEDIALLPLQLYLEHCILSICTPVQRSLYSCTTVLYLVCSILGWTGRMDRHDLGAADCIACEYLSDMQTDKKLHFSVSLFLVLLFNACLHPFIPGNLVLPISSTASFCIGLGKELLDYYDWSLPLMPRCPCHADADDIAYDAAGVGAGILLILFLQKLHMYHSNRHKLEVEAHSSEERL